MKRMPSLIGLTWALTLGVSALLAGCSSSSDAAAPTDSAGGGAGSAGSAGAGGAAGMGGEEHPDCDPLVPTACGYPFPSNYYLADDTTGKNPSGKTVRFGTNTLPKPFGKMAHVDAAAFADSDGFSPGQGPMVHMPEATTTGLPTFNALGDSIKADSTPTILMEADTGELVPHWAELDMSAKRPEERALMIRPAVRLKDKTRYIVAFRHIKDGAGADIPAVDAFKALRDGTPSPEPSIEARRARYADEIFKPLEGKGIQKADLQIAWDYTTASRENNTRAMLKMRDEALALVGEDGPTYTIKAVETENISDKLLARVVLDMEVPLYMTSANAGGDTKMNLGDDGLPKQNGTAKYEVLVLVPKDLEMPGEPVGVLQNGHGLLGDKREGQGGYLAEMAHRHRFVAFGVDFVGFAGEDVPTVTEALTTNFHAWRACVDRQHQGHLNGLLAMRMMKGRIAKEGLKADDGTVLIPPGLIDPKLAFYRGDSQGGIMGTSYMALSTDVTRGLLGEPGMPYNLLLNRSHDYPAYSLLLTGTYDNGLDAQLMLGVMQMFWDRTEPNGYAPYITSNPLPGTPAHEVLLHVAIGDFQVTPLGAHIIARTTGAKNLKPVNREIYGVESVDGPIQGSAIVEYSFNLPESPLTNIPPPGKGDDDPHDKVRKLDPSYDQSNKFFREGIVANFCDGICDCSEVLACKDLSDGDKASCNK
jgi:hypothetical protein